MAARRAIFITGGGSGIGRAIAQRFGAEGWFVGLGDVDERGMAETEALLASGFTYSHRFDVRDRTAWDEALGAFATAAGGRIDVLANNAGVPLAGPLGELTREEIDRTLDINLKGVIYGAQAALPFLRQTAPGSCLLNTASAAALYGMAQQSIYGATKAGVRSLTESLDSEWADFGIRVCSLMPSFIDTPLLQHTPNAASNVAIRQTVIDAGLEFTPVEVVAANAWAAVHGNKLHYVVGATARKMLFAAKWTPGKLRRRAALLREAHDRAQG